MSSGAGLAQVLEVVLALYSVVVFATLAGVLGAYFLEGRGADGPRGQVRPGGS